MSDSFAGSTAGSISASAPAKSGPGAVPTLPCTLGALNRLPGDTLVVFLPQDVRPLRGAAGYLDWRLCGALSQTFVEGTFSGAPREVMLMPTGGRLGRRRVFAFGLGPRGEVQMEAACRHAVEVLERAGVREVLVVAPDDGALELQGSFLQTWGRLAKGWSLSTLAVLIDPDAAPSG